MKLLILKCTVNTIYLFKKNVRVYISIHLVALLSLANESSHKTINERILLLFDIPQR